MRISVSGIERRRVSSGMWRVANRVALEGSFGRNAARSGGDWGEWELADVEGH